MAKKNHMTTNIRLIIIESVNPMDLLQRRTESQALEEICKIIGHEVAILRAFSKSDFIKFCEYISSISSGHDKRERKEVPLCIHIATHGNSSGLQFGKDIVEWKDISHAMRPIYENMNDYDGEVILVISACGAGSQTLTIEFIAELKRNRNFLPPKYVFVTKDEYVSWSDAVVSWSMFYHQLARADLNQRESIQNILKKIQMSDTGNLNYFRWDDNTRQYLKYPSKRIMKFKQLRKSSLTLRR
jgi:hypothetical protein